MGPGGKSRDELRALQGNPVSVEIRKRGVHLKIIKSNKRVFEGGGGGRGENSRFGGKISHKETKAQKSSPRI